MGKYKRALENHLCPFDMADWIACSGHEEQHCIICEETDGPHRHVDPDTQKRQRSRVPEVCQHTSPFVLYHDDCPELEGEVWEIAMYDLGHNVSSHINEQGPCDLCGIGGQSNV